MTPIELQDCMNVYITLWKSAILGNEHRDSMVEMWKNRGFLDLKKDLLIKAFYEYEDSNEKNYIAPRVNQILSAYKVVQTRLQDKSNRRIETPEEVMAQIFHDEMKKPHNKRDYELLERTKFYAGLFQDEQAYIKYFGKPREEYERY